MIIKKIYLFLLFFVINIYLIIYDLSLWEKRELIVKMKLNVIVF